MKNPLQSWRKEIDRIDLEIITRIAKRFRIAEQIGKYKKVHKFPVRNLKRERVVLENRVAAGKKVGIHTQVTKSIFSLMLRESRRIQKGITK